MCMQLVGFCLLSDGNKILCSWRHNLSFIFFSLFPIHFKSQYPKQFPWVPFFCKVASYRPAALLKKIEYSYGVVYDRQHVHAHGVGQICNMLQYEMVIPEALQNHLGMISNLLIKCISPRLSKLLYTISPILLISLFFRNANVLFSHRVYQTKF